MASEHKLLSSVSSLSLSTGNGLAETVAKTEMEKLLECPVCTEIPLPPIYTCETGHSICKNCKAKLKECGICKKPYTNSRNFALESMIQVAKFHCKYHSEGCRETGNLDELTNHGKICTFKPLRPVKCFLDDRNDCKEEMLYISDFADHLKNVHGAISTECSIRKENTFVEQFGCTDWEKEKLKTSKYWKARFLNYDDNVFMTQAFLRGTLVCIRCILIGEESEAAKYAVKITIQKDSAEVPSCVLTTMVESLRMVSENPGRLPPTIVHKYLMETLGNFSPEEKSKEAIQWKITYEIIKQRNT